MADQAITALPKKTYSGSSKIAATDYLLGIDSAEGYQMLIQDLGEYIINRVTASLAGSNQTLAAAISALNSNFAGSISKAVNSWTDAIEAAKNANYRIVSVRINGTDSQNLPTGFNVHWGTIYCNPGGTYGAAILQSFSGDIYTKGLSAGTWTDWQKQPTRAEVDALKNTLSPTLSGCGSNSAIHAVQIGTVVAVTAKIEYSGTNNMAISGLPNHNGDTQNGFVFSARDQTDGSIVRMWTNGGKNIMKYDNLTEGHMYGLSYTYITA